MDIPKEKLSLMGISIKVNRKELFRKTKAGKWTQINLAENICSPNTLANIERGKASRFPNLYMQLAKNLEMDVIYNHAIDEMLERVFEKLYLAAEFHDIQKVKYHCNRALDILKDFKDALWYCDIYKVIKCIKEYHLKSILLPPDYFEFYIDVLGELNFYAKEMMKSIIFNSAYADTSSQKYFEIYEKLEIKESTSTFNEINQLMYLFSLNKTSKFQNQVKFLEQKYTETKNYLRLLDVYNLSITYFSYFDQDEIDNYSKKIDLLIESQNELVSVKLYDIYFCLGIAYHKIGRYEDAIRCMWKSYELDINKVKRIFLFLANSQRKLNLPIKIPRYSKTALSRFSLDDKLMYRYYIMDEQGFPELFRQKFIMEKVLPALHGTDDLSIGIMREELGNLVQITNQYKDLYIFDIKVRELNANL